MVTDRQLVSAAEKRRRAQQDSREQDDRFAILVATARAEGRTARQLAELLGMGASTVQDWTRRGKALLKREG